MQHFLKIAGKRYGEVRKFKKVRKFASSNLKFRSSKFKFTEILICNPGYASVARAGIGHWQTRRGPDAQTVLGAKNDNQKRPSTLQGDREDRRFNAPACA